jgi:two-component system OmpR family sensor kinase
MLAETHKLSDRRIQTDLVSPAWLYGSPDHFRRILRNLLDNAVRYASNTIFLSLTVIEDRVILSVEDDGPGIPASDREWILQRFRHVKRNRGQRQQGPGLGLAIVRSLVLQYGGEVTVSDSPLGGAKFVVTLPAAKD